MTNSRPLSRRRCVLCDTVMAPKRQGDMCYLCKQIAYTRALRVKRLAAILRR